ncbi:uncharacterized protein ISCGN_026919 [Ixodes scapularis]
MFPWCHCSQKLSNRTPVYEKQGPKWCIASPGGPRRVQTYPGLDSTTRMPFSSDTGKPRTAKRGRANPHGSGSVETPLSKHLLSQDFRQEMARCGVLGDIAALGAYQMNHVWMATLRTAEAKRRLVDAKELQAKGLRCLVVDPSITELRLRLHWIPYDVPDDVVRKELEPYGKVLEVSREKWNVEGFQGIESTTRSYARVASGAGTAETNDHAMDAEEAERTIQGLAPEVSTPAKERKSEENSSLEAAREN